MQWIVVSLSDRSGICRQIVEAWLGLSGQVARCTEGSCAVITDRLAQRRLRPTATAHEQKDDFLFTSWPVILSVFVSLMVGTSVQATHSCKHIHITHNQCYSPAIVVLSFPVNIFCFCFLCLHLFLLFLPTKVLLYHPLWFFSSLWFQNNIYSINKTP